MTRKHTLKYLLIIIACSIVPALLLPLLPGINTTLLVIYPFTIALPALLAGLVVQSLVNFRGRSKRTPLNGSTYYGAYLAVVISALRVGIILVAVLSRV